MRTAPAQIIAKATAPHVVTYTDRLSGISCELFHNPAYGAFYVVRWNANDTCGPAFTTRAAALGALERELRGAAFMQQADKRARDAAQDIAKRYPKTLAMLRMQGIDAVLSAHGRAVKAALPA